MLRAQDRARFDASTAVDPEHRATVPADALADLIDFLADHDGLDDRVAFTEPHNEVQGGFLTEGLTGDLVVYGVPDELPDTFALRDSSRPFPGTPPARSSTWSARFPAPPRFRGVRET
ncbi:hypothetical protein [Streptomyces violaceorubidus]|uniref:Uncharacterized protein n=1 Tax=Streptomyces violaceorubidus TaxID=284042 RepID=A0ABV1SQQ2_9ACTN